MRRVLILLLSTVVAALAVALSPQALSLRNQGIAELENERPADAEKSFSKVVKTVPGDPLGYANLAIATLRQQKSDEALAWIDKALERAPGRAELLAIKGDVLQWSGSSELALELYQAAAAAGPDDVEILYSLYRHATTIGESTGEAGDAALTRLAELRPENAVILLQQGKRAIARGDRAAASAAFLRIGELLWQAPPIATQALGMVTDALEEDVAKARIPALRLENVLKVSPMFQQGLRELSVGIQGNPIARFVDEPPALHFGEPLEITWKAHEIGSGRGAAVALADFDGDRATDLAWIVDDRLELRAAARRWQPGEDLPAAGVDRLIAADLDNDGHWDLVGSGPGGLRAWRGDGSGGFAAAEEQLGLAGSPGVAVAAFDFDIEGDLDLAVAQPDRLELFRNALDGPLEAVGSHAFARSSAEGIVDLVASDFDRDGDLDLVGVGPVRSMLLDNLRQGELVAKPGGALDDTGARRVISADLDNDGLPDVGLAGTELKVLRNTGHGFEPAALPAVGPVAAVTAIDFDNDGRLDLAAGGPDGVILLHQKEKGFERESAATPGAIDDLAAADLDDDGDLDLVAVGTTGMVWLENVGGHRNRWLSTRLQGLTTGNSKNNVFGLGSTLEVRAGAAYQFREAQGGVTHFGLGSLGTADLLRVVWTNGVPQNRLQIEGNQRVVEEQLLKGSCPFLYTWTGDRIDFVTDLLWGAPIGLPVAPGIWAGADPQELVKVEGAVARDGRYDLRITEELWEAAFFDSLRLWVVDHPVDVEVASSLRIVPGESLPEAVLGSRRLQQVAAAWDGSGRIVTERVARRDEIYADGFVRSAYQGLAAEPWAFTFDLGTATSGPIRLHLDGWIFPTDASLNLALAQRGGGPELPRLEVETAAGWQPLMPTMGFPAGKTKTMVIDTPPLPPASRRLRIVTSQWLSWDRIAWTTAPADDAQKLRGRLAPSSAILDYRGFSAPRRFAPNAPHSFDYGRVDRESPWLPFPGRYTRYGDVAELLETADDRSVILSAGDELRLLFDATDLPPTPPGWQRAVFLESHGWDKDADRNTYEGQQVEPLPFRAMSGYPYGAGEAFPTSPVLEAYRREWLTRVVASGPPSSGR